MEIRKYLQDFKNANESNDPSKMMAAMQEFFAAIHSAGHCDGKLLGIYSMAQQLEVSGIDSTVIKKAVRSRVDSQVNGTFPILWKDIAIGLNSMLEGDGLPLIIIDPKKT